MELYNYDKTTLDDKTYAISGPEVLGGLYHYHITFPSPYNTGIEKNDTVHAEIFQKHTAKRAGIRPHKDMVIIVHGFGTGNRKLFNYNSFACSMAEKGMTAVFISLPYHVNRTPEKESGGERLRYFNDVQTLIFFHQSVVDIRRLMDILEAVLKPRNIYICGISLGCMVSTITMAFDRRIKKGALLLGGGNWEEIHWRGIMRFILQGNCSPAGRKGNRAVCRSVYREFPRFMDRIKEKDGKSLFPDTEDKRLKEVMPRYCFLCDPMAFGHMIDPGNILMINSMFDLYFSIRSVRGLWRQLGRPTLNWTAAPHSSRILVNNKIINMIYDFYTC